MYVGDTFSVLSFVIKSSIHATSLLNPFLLISRPDRRDFPSIARVERLRKGTRIIRGRPAPAPTEGSDSSS